MYRTYAQKSSHFIFCFAAYQVKVFQFDERSIHQDLIVRSLDPFSLLVSDTVPDFDASSYDDVYL